jgi:hypothetical protein
MGPSVMARREVSRVGARDDERREADEVGNMRVVFWVVESQRGINSRPMLPEADVRRIDFGGIAFFIDRWFSGLVG